MPETDNQSESWWQDHLAAIQDADTVRADLFVRSLGIPIDSQQCQASAIRRLEELEAEGPITTTTVRIWGDRIYPDDPCAETPAGRFILDKVEEIESWAAQTDGVQLEFERGRATSSLTDEARTLIRLPCYCLSIYLDGTLSAVVPCSIDNRQYGLFDYFDAIEKTSELTVSPPKVSVDPARIQ